VYVYCVGTPTKIVFKVCVVTGTPRIIYLHLSRYTTMKLHFGDGQVHHFEPHTVGNVGSWVLIRRADRIKWAFNPEKVDRC